MTGSRGATTFGNSVNVASVADTGSTAINGGGVATSAGQSYNGAVTLGADAANSGTTINYGGSVIGAFNLADGGSTTFGKSVNVASVTDTGSTAINGGGVTTSAGQSYNGAVSLGADAANSGTTINYGGAVSGAFNLADSGPGGSATSTTFGKSVNVASVSDTGSTAINGGDVTTSAGQSYGGDVTLGADATLNGTGIGLLGGVTFNGDFLVLNNSGQATFGGTFDQFNLITFNRSMSLSSDTTLDGTKYTLPAVDGTVAGSQSLTANGQVTFGGAVGGNIALKNVTVVDPDAFTLNQAMTGTGELSITAGEGSGNGVTVINQSINGPAVTFSDLHLIAEGEYQDIEFLCQQNKIGNIAKDYTKAQTASPSALFVTGLYGGGNIWVSGVDYPVQAADIQGGVNNQLASALAEIRPEPKKAALTITNEPSQVSIPLPPGYILRSSQVGLE